MQNQIVSHDEWLSARQDLLAAEKEMMRQHDALAQRRRALPWERVDKSYRFEGRDGVRTLAELFEARSQLLVYHFMLGPDWEEGCKSCSFWADNFDGIPIHLNHRDVTFTAVSRAPLAKIEAYRNRMGWHFPWVSSYGSDFNFDYQVSYSPQQLAEGQVYHNYKIQPMKVSEQVGISVFARSGRDEVFHTYSCYGRGVEVINGAYQWLDLTPKGRDEDGLGYPMEWVKRHDEY